MLAKEFDSYDESNESPLLVRFILNIIIITKYICSACVLIFSLTIESYVFLLDLYICLSVYFILV